MDEARHRNPFRYGSVATGAYFTDRDVELADLEADLRNAQDVVIISPRRYGKTSLVVRATERLRDERILTAYLDLFRTPTKERFADHLADALYGGLVAPLERVWQQAVGVFQKLPLQPRITVNSDGTPSFEFTAGQHSRDVDRTIESLLELPQRIAEDRRRRVVLVLDEFQEVTAIDPELPALMRSVFQLQGEVAHVFLGSKRHLMEEVFTSENQPLYRLAKPMTLGPIPTDDFSNFIHERFAATGRGITDAATARILTITGGHPHDTQELCYFAWSLAEAEDAPASPEVVDRALARVVEAEDARYTTLWEQLSRHQRLVLTALLDDGRAVLSETYRRRHRLGSASAVQRSLSRLVDRELIEFSAQDGYRVPDVFLRSWIARIASPPSSR